MRNFSFRTYPIMLEVGVAFSQEVRPNMFRHPYLDKEVKSFVDVTEAGSLFTTLLFILT